MVISRTASVYSTHSDTPTASDMNYLVNLASRSQVSAAQLIQQVSKVEIVRFRNLFRYAKLKDWVLMSLGLVFCFISGAAQPLTTLIFKDITNAMQLWDMQSFPGQLITSQEFQKQVTRGSVFFVILAIVAFLSSYLYTSTFMYTSERQAYEFRKRYLWAALHQNMAWYDLSGSGQVSVRISSDINKIKDGIGEKIPSTIQQIATFITAMIIAFSINAELAGVLFTIIPLILVTLYLMNLVGSKIQIKASKQGALASSWADEVLSAIRTVIAFGAQTKMSGIYNEYTRKARLEGIKKSYFFGISSGIVWFLIFSGYSLAFYYGSRLLEQGKINAGDVIGVFFAIIIGAFSLGNVAPSIQAFVDAVAAGRNVIETIDRVPEINSLDETGSIIPSSEFQGRIILKDVSFAYPTRRQVRILDHMNLVIEPNTTVALVGESGSGKSTIIQLLERFYNPLSGSIEIDSRPLNSLNIKWLRQHLALVSQDSTLFEGTVADNISFGLLGTSLESLSEDQKMERIIEACKLSNAHDFISSLPQGYHTKVGNRGSLLSGGQKQRICIARAIIKNPKILLLDEATSALDTTSERMVQEALDKASKGRTTIVIAHRLSTIRNADQIVVMVKGKITEIGTHESLLDIQEGLYKRLVEAQTVSKSSSDDPLNTAKNDQDDADSVKTDVPEEQQDKRLSKRNSTVRFSHPNVDDVESATQKDLSLARAAFLLMRLGSPEWGYQLIAFLACIVNGMIFPSYSIAFGGIMQVFTLTGDALISGANFWSLIFFVIAIVNLIANFFQNAFFGISSEYLSERLRNLIFTYIMRQDVEFFDDEKNATGILVSNLKTDPEDVEAVTGSTVGTILQIVITLVGGIIIGFVYGWKLTLVAACALPLLLMAGYLRIRILAMEQERAKKSYDTATQLASEAITSIRTVQFLTKEQDVYEKYQQNLDKPVQESLVNAWKSTLLFAFSNSANLLVNGLVFWYGGYLILNEGYNMQQFFVVFVAIVFGAMGIGRIFTYAGDISKARLASQNMYKIVIHKPIIDTWSAKGKIALEANGEIEFKNVQFYYPTRPHIQVLKGLDLHIKPGCFVAFVGPSGCGKSTTIGLLERFYEINKGSIYLDGDRIDDYNIASYRKMVGLVSQEPNLFDLTIRENICLGCATLPTQDTIEQAAKDANIHEFIINLPDKYDTRLGNKGGQLSGGQKQRIAIARALILNPKILLLDEATSALDAESEKIVQSAIDSASKGRTTISIAHRLSTIQHADLIVVFKDGIVVEKGSHQVLFDKKGLYYELVMQQDLSRK